MMGEQSMSKSRFFKKATVATLVIGLVLSLSVPAIAQRGRGKRAVKHINNVVNIARTVREIFRLTCPPSASTDCKFEKGDVVLRRMDVDEVNWWIGDIGSLLGRRGRGLVIWLRRFVSQLSIAGHSGLYMEWEADEYNDPGIKKSHTTIESHSEGPNYDNFGNFVKIRHFWGVRTSDKLNDRKRRDLVDAAESQIREDIGYDFFSGYKSEGVSFRCDGLVEWAYETVDIDIIPRDWWCVAFRRNLLCARKQLDALNEQNKAELPTLTCGKYDGQGEKIYGPREIAGEDVEPDEDGKYEVYGDEVKVQIYANDIDDDNDGSGITRVQLWVGEPDDTPEEMPGFRIVGDEDDENYPVDHDYVYIWDTTQTIQKDGNEESLFPNGDYTLKAIGFDQAGNKKEATLPVEVANPKKYLYVHIEPCFVETDGSDDTQTESFTIYVEAWNPGSGGTTPEGGVNKKEGTQSYKIEDGKPVLETCYTDQVEEATKDDTFNSIVNISTLFSDIDGISLYKEGWDGTVELTNGSGNVSGVRYKTDDGSELTDGGQIIIRADEENMKGNAKLDIIGIPGWAYLTRTRYYYREADVRWFHSLEGAFEDAKNKILSSHWPWHQPYYWDHSSSMFAIYSEGAKYVGDGGIPFDPAYRYHLVQRRLFARLRISGEIPEGARIWVVYPLSMYGFDANNASPYDWEEWHLPPDSGYEIGEIRVELTHLLPAGGDKEIVMVGGYENVGTIVPEPGGNRQFMKYYRYDPPKLLTDKP
jgi:hypothetical protein